jgi:hypothetical protein
MFRNALNPFWSFSSSPNKKFRSKRAIQEYALPQTTHQQGRVDVVAVREEWKMRQHAPPGVTGGFLLCLNLEVALYSRSAAGS